MDSFEWLWQGLAVEAVRWLLVAVGGIAIAILKARGSKWAGPAVYGLAGFACLSIVVFTVRASNYLDRLLPREPITTQSIERITKGWIESMNYGIRKVQTEDTLFNYFVGLPSGEVTVSCHRDLNRYLKIGTTVVLSNSHREALNKLPKDEAEKLAGDLRIALVNLGVEYTDIRLPLTKVGIAKHVAISDSLTEDQFLFTLHTVNSAGIVATEIIRRRLGFTDRS